MSDPLGFDAGHDLQQHVHLDSGDVVEGQTGLPFQPHQLGLEAHADGLTGPAR